MDKFRLGYFVSVSGSVIFEYKEILHFGPALLLWLPSLIPHLGLLLLCGVDDGGAADLGQLAALTVEGPAADLVPDHVFDEEDAAVEAERQSVEQLDVLQQVVVRVAVETKGKLMWKRSASRLTPLCGLWFINLLA